MDVTKVFGEAVGDASPELRPLVAGALRDGTAIRRRRTAGMAGAVAAVVAVAVGGALLAAPGQGGAVAGPAAGSVVSSDSAASGQVALTGQAAVKTLIGLLPAGPVSQYVGRDGLPSELQPEIRGQVSYQDGPGSATVGVTVEPQFIEAKDKLEGTYNCSMRGPVSITCRSTVRPDGSKLLVWEWHVGEQLQRGADLLRTDGMRVTASTTSLMDSKKGKVLREQPPLTAEQLEAVVLSPAWTARITAEQAAQAAAEIQPYLDGRTTLAPTAP